MAAGGQALAMSSVRRLKEIRVYSPTRENRERMASDLAAQVDARVVAAEDARSAARDADIVGMATNSITPVAELDWIAPHAHVTCVKELELGPGILSKSALVVVHTRLDKPANYIVGEGENPIYDHDPAQGLTEEIAAARRARPPSEVDLGALPDLGELVAGKAPVPGSGEMTTFVNTVGMGLQFAAIGSLIFEKARERGLGREIPTDWLLEDVHP